MRILGYLTVENTRDGYWLPRREYRHKQTDAEKQFDKQQIAKGGMQLQQAGQLGASSATERNTLLPAYQSILKDPGYSSADKSAITLNTMGGLGAAYGDAENTATNRYARTRNTAGFGENLDELARSRARDTSATEAGLQEKFADMALSERDKALTGMSDLYGVDTRTMAELLSQQRPSPNPPGAFTSAVAGALGKWISPLPAGSGGAGGYV